MLTDNIGTEIHLDTTYDEGIDQVVEALKAEGFGVLTRIDVKQAFKDKIGEDFRPYVILGACNPKLAHKALSNTSEIGLMLPCNVTVEEAPGGGVTVRIVKPELMLRMGSLADNEVLERVADEASERLARVAKSLE